MLQTACLAELIRRYTGETPTVLDYRSRRRESVCRRHPSRTILLKFMQSTFRLSPTFTDPWSAAEWVNRHCETAIHGSDEIWKWGKNRYCDPMPNLYWGSGIQCRRKIAYAVSIGPARLHRPPEEIATLLQSFAQIGVRDSHTARLISRYRAVCRVPDPTLGVDPGELFPEAQRVAEQILAGRPRPLLLLSDPRRYHLAAGWQPEQVLTTIPTPYSQTIGPQSPPVRAALHGLVDQVATQRFHSTILAFRHGTPLIVDTNRHKVVDLLANWHQKPGSVPVIWSAEQRTAGLTTAEHQHAAFLQKALSS
ncbi:MAG: polysaccharide pyruvyl transferase family protein [Bacteroidales bacterium]|nr:polysaccharide pyruvyl transferase family protein [Bacteroidales bacterium]